MSATAAVGTLMMLEYLQLAGMILIGVAGWVGFRSWSRGQDAKRRLVTERKARETEHAMVAADARGPDRKSVV